MNNTAVFIAAVAALAALGIAGFTVIAQVLGQRITDLGNRIDRLDDSLTGRMERLELRVGHVEERLTVLEVKLGER